MNATLIRNADMILTMDDEGAEFAGDIRIEDGVIAAVGANLPVDGATVVEASGCLVTPGLVIICSRP